MKTTLVLVFFLLGSSILAQSDFPKYGTLADLDGLSKYYINADAEAKEQIEKRLKKLGWKAVGDPVEAEIFVEYRELAQNETLFMRLARGQMDIFIFRDGSRVVAWSKVASGGAYKGNVAHKLSGQFLDALKKRKKEEKADSNH